MSDTLAMLNAVSEPISTPEAPLTGTYWSPSTLSDHITCTIVGTNPQIAESRSLVLSPSTCEGFLSEELRQRPAALFISLSTTPRKASTRKSRKARAKNLKNLKGWQVNDLFRADAIAGSMGFGLNWFATINWLDTSVGSDDFSEAFQLGCKRMGQWLRDQGGGYPVIYIYAHENPDGIRPNTHILLHLPTGLIKRFVAQLGGWFGALNDAAIDIQPRMKAGYTSDERLQYMIKGAHHCVCKAYGGHRKRGGQGPINFKRSGVCQFLRSEFGGRHDKWGRPIRKEASEMKMLMSGDELRMKREHSGLTQTGLAKLVGLHRNSVSRLERLPPIRQTSSHALKSILKALGENTPDVYRF